MRVKAIIAYNGKQFYGFQRQKSTKDTIMTTIESALLSLGVNSSIIGSGRTDTGVHASGQVIHFDIPDFWSNLDKLKEHINGKLTAIEFKHITYTHDTFHARFDAKERIYRYVFKTHKPSVFEENFVAHLEIKKYAELSKALECFIGEHDFSNFLKTGSTTKDNIRSIYKAYHKQRGNYHYIYFHANGFLRAQVRMMIDFAVKVSNDELTLKQLKEQLALKNTYNHRLAPPQGLYLARVIY